MDINELKRMKREYDSLFEDVPCFIVVLDQDLRIVRTNRLMRSAFGDVIGNHCFQNYKRRSQKCVDCPAERTFADGEVHRTTQVLTSKEGEEAIFVVTTSPHRRSNGNVTHVIEMAVDITQVQLLEDQLAVYNAFRSALIGCAIDAIVATDPHDHVIVFNRTAEKLFGYLGSNLQGRSLPTSILPQTLPPQDAWVDDRVLLPETEVKSSDGTILPVRCSGVLLKREKQLVGKAFFMQDLRPIKQLENEKIDAERLAAVGQTVAGLAHGIKNILTGLEGGMYVMKKGREKGIEQRIDLGWGMLERNVVRTSTLVKNLLTFSKGSKPQIEILRPDEIATEVVDLFKGSARQNNITLTAQIQSNMSTAPMDREGIHICLTNLVSNALDACQLSDHSDTSVTVKCFETDDAIVFEVEDSGVGMDYEIKRKVFTNFFTTKGSGGTGIGLLQTRRITQQHGGSIDMESTLGMGSTFRLTFPRNRLPRPPGDTPTESKV